MRVRLLSIVVAAAALVLGFTLTSGIERAPAPIVAAQELTLAVGEAPAAIAAVDTNGVRAAPGRLLTRADTFAGFLPIAALLAAAFVARRRSEERLALARVDRGTRISAARATSARLRARVARSSVRQPNPAVPRPST